MNPDNGIREHRDPLTGEWYHTWQCVDCNATLEKKDTNVSEFGDVRCDICHPLYVAQVAADNADDPEFQACVDCGEKYAVGYGALDANGHCGCGGNEGDCAFEDMTYRIADVREEWKR